MLKKSAILFIVMFPIVTYGIYMGNTGFGILLAIIVGSIVGTML